MGQNLYQASHEWATRPDDQRYLTLAELRTAAHAKQAASKARDLALSTLTVEYDRVGGLAINDGQQSLGFNNWSFGQLARLVGAPADYLRKLSPVITATNLNYGLAFGQGAEVDAKFYYTPPAVAGGVGTARAFTGVTYGRIYDAQVADQVTRLVERSPQWAVPLKAYGGVNSKRATTLYLSDRDLFIFLVDESRPIDIEGQTYFRGFFTWNSEVGNATLGVATFLYSHVCANRIIWNARNVQPIRIRHNALAPEHFMYQVAPALDALAEASPQPIIDTIRAAKRTRVAPDVAGVEAWLKKQGFGEAESKVAINLAQQGGETGSSGDPTNVWDLVQGGTAAARSISHTDARVDQERKWSALLSQISGASIPDDRALVAA